MRNLGGSFSKAYHCQLAASIEASMRPQLASICLARSVVEEAGCRSVARLLSCPCSLRKKYKESRFPASAPRCSGALNKLNLFSFLVSPNSRLGIPSHRFCGRGDCLQCIRVGGGQLAINTAGRPRDSTKFRRPWCSQPFRPAGFRRALGGWKGSRSQFDRSRNADFRLRGIRRSPIGAHLREERVYY